MKTYMAVLAVISAVEGLILPSLMFDARNPFFSCDVPTIKVHPEDRMVIFCPNHGVTNVLQQSGELMFDKMHIVETEEEFNSCDATNGYAKLLCDGSTLPQDRTCKDSSAQCTSYRNEIFVPKAGRHKTDYQPGSTHHFIGTSFHTRESYDNKLGGSCNTTGPDSPYRLRFKIYVCTKEEIKRGECERCTTPACFYKDCTTSCTPWVKDTSKIYQTTTGKCFVKEHRNCFNRGLSTTTQQFQDSEIPCPSPICGNWFDTKEFTKTEVSCNVTQNRRCSDKINGEIHTETRSVPLAACPSQLCTNWVVDEEKVFIQNASCYTLQRRDCSELGQIYEDVSRKPCPCPFDVPVSQSSAQTESGDDVNLYKYIAIGAAIGAFLLGLLSGGFCWKCQHDKTCMNNSEVIMQTTEVIRDPNGYTNKGFLPQNGDNDSNINFHFNNGVFAPVGRLDSGSGSSTSGSAFHTGLTRSLSLQYGDEQVFTGPEIVQYRTYRTRRPGKTVNRNSSATSRTQLVRHVSDLSDRCLSRASSEFALPTDSFKAQHKVEAIQEV